MKNNLQKKNKGVAALLTIVIIGAASLIMAIGASRLGLGELETGLNEIRGAQVLVLADGCLEEALYKLKKNNSYAGATLSLGGGSCIISISGGGSTRTILSTATLGSYTKRVEMTVTLGGTVISIDTWGEI